MRPWVATLSLALLLFSVIAPQAGASTISTGGGSSSQTCRDFPVATAPATIASGDIIYCIMTDGPVPTSTSTFQASAILTTPALSSSTNTVTFTPSVSDSSCTFGSATTKGTPSMNGAYGTQSSATWIVTMTSGNCHGYIEGKVTSNGVVVFDDAFAFDVEALDVPTYVNNAVAVTGTLDTLSRTCQASAFGAACTAPRTNEDVAHCATPIPATDLTKFTVVGTIRYCIRYPSQVPAGTHFLVQQELTYPQLVSGTDSLSSITDTFSGGTGCTIFGSAFETSRVTSGGLTTSRQSSDVAMTGSLCSTSWQAQVPSSSPAYNIALAATITTPTLDEQSRFCAASSFGASCTTPSMNLAITSWPSLVAAVANSGSIGVVNSGGQALTLSGAISNAVSGALSVTNSGTVNNVNSGAITVTNAGGQAITVTSWPELHAVLSGRVNTTASMVNIGNSTTSVNFPSTLHLCGGVLVNTTCAPIGTASTVYTPSAQADLMGMLLGFWPVFTFFATFLLPKRGAFAGTAVRVVSLLALALLPSMPAPGRFAFVVVAIVLLGYEVFNDGSTRKPQGDYSLPY